MSKQLRAIGAWLVEEWEDGSLPRVGLALAVAVLIVTAVGTR